MGDLVHSVQKATNKSTYDKSLENVDKYIETVTPNFSSIKMYIDKLLGLDHLKTLRTEEFILKEKEKTQRALATEKLATQSSSVIQACTEHFYNLRSKNKVN